MDVNGVVDILLRNPEVAFHKIAEEKCNEAFKVFNANPCAEVNGGPTCFIT
jgi:hypothetical protein